MSFTPVLRSIVVGVAVALVLVGTYAWGHGTRAVAAASAPPAPPVPTASASAGSGISVTGTGHVTGTPNLLRLQTSVDVTKPAVTDAMQGANTVMADVQKVLKSDGVAAADLQTSGLSVQPNYTYSDNAQQLTGYTVSENLGVVLRDLSTAGSIISDAARVGGNSLQIGEASLDLDQDDALITQARQSAFADAQAKAKTYASAAGRTLGAVTSISESDDVQPQTLDYSAAAPAAAAGLAPVPIQAGSQDITVDVAVTWAFR